MAHGYEQVGVAEIRDILRNEYDVDDEEFLSSNKTVLVEKLLELKNEIIKNAIEEIEAMEFDVLGGVEVEAEEVEMVEGEAFPEEAVLPVYGTKEWTEFILDELEDDEKVGDRPFCDGLRRMVEKYVGPIQVREIPHISPPSESDYIATVVVSVQVPIIQPSHPWFGILDYLQESAVADVTRDNMKEPFINFPSATASTMAESRCLKNVLRLRKVVTAEEVGAEVWDDNEAIPDEQIDIIDLVAKRNNISVGDALKVSNVKNIRELTKTRGVKLLGYLHKIIEERKKSSTAHENIGKYNSEWRA